MRLSACIIARDEESFLPRCLASLQGVVDEICVLDTGSCDRTLEIARLAGAVTGFRAWDQNFSAARNACLELASGDWILQIDADEEIAPNSLPGLRQDLESGPACRLVEVELLDGTARPGTIKLARIFQRDDRIRYQRQVHESVVDSVREAGLPEPTLCQLRLIHHGYLPEVIADRDKQARNLSILRNARDLGTSDSYDLYKLGTTLPTWDASGERSQALEAAWKAGLSQKGSMRSEWPWWDRLAQTLSLDFTRRGQLQRGSEIACQAIDSSPGNSPLSLGSLAEIHLRGGLYPQALELCARATSDLRHTTGLVALSGKDAAELEWIAARAARACRQREMFLDHLQRSIALGSLEARCLQAGWKISEAIPEGWKELDLLLRSDSRHPAVLLTASEAARSQGDRSTSDLLLEQASQIPSDAANVAASRLWMRAWLDGQTPEFHRPPFDLEATAIHGFLAMVNQRPWNRDPWLPAKALHTALADILEALLEAGQPDAVRRFAKAALTREADLPGISTLVEDN